jgi:hypothetical protein
MHRGMKHNEHNGRIKPFYVWTTQSMTGLTERLGFISQKTIENGNGIKI